MKNFRQSGYTSVPCLCYVTSQPVETMFFGIKNVGFLSKCNTFIGSISTQKRDIRVRRHSQPPFWFFLQKITLLGADFSTLFVVGYWHGIEPEIIMKPFVAILSRLFAGWLDYLFRKTQNQGFSNFSLVSDCPMAVLTDHSSTVCQNRPGFLFALNLRVRFNTSISLHAPSRYDIRLDSSFLDVADFPCAGLLHKPVPSSTGCLPTKSNTQWSTLPKILIIYLFNCLLFPASFYMASNM